MQGEHEVNALQQLREELSVWPGSGTRAQTTGDSAAEFVATVSTQPLSEIVSTFLADRRRLAALAERALGAAQGARKRAALDRAAADAEMTRLRATADAANTRALHAQREVALLRQRASELGVALEGPDIAVDAPASDTPAAAHQIVQELRRQLAATENEVHRLGVELARSAAALDAEAQQASALQVALRRAADAAADDATVMRTTAARNRAHTELRLRMLRRAQVEALHQIRQRSDDATRGLWFRSWVAVASRDVLGRRVVELEEQLRAAQKRVAKLQAGSVLNVARSHVAKTSNNADKSDEEPDAADEAAARAIAAVTRGGGGVAPPAAAQDGASAAPSSLPGAVEGGSHGGIGGGGGMAVREAIISARSPSPVGGTVVVSPAAMHHGVNTSWGADSTLGSGRFLPIQTRGGSVDTTTQVQQLLMQQQRVEGKVSDLNVQALEAYTTLLPVLRGCRDRLSIRAAPCLPLTMSERPTESLASLVLRWMREACTPFGVCFRLEERLQKARRRVVAYTLAVRGRKIALASRLAMPISSSEAFALRMQQGRFEELSGRLAGIRAQVTTTQRALLERHDSGHERTVESIEHAVAVFGTALKDVQAEQFRVAVQLTRVTLAHRAAAASKVTVAEVFPPHVPDPSRRLRRGPGASTPTPQPLRPGDAGDVAISVPPAHPAAGAPAVAARAATPIQRGRALAQELRRMIRNTQPEAASGAPLAPPPFLGIASVAPKHRAARVVASMSPGKAVRASPTGINSTLTPM